MGTKKEKAAKEFWKALKDTERNALKNILPEEEWINLEAENINQWNTLVDFIVMRDVLKVPALRRDLPSYRGWKIPLPEKDALADLRERETQDITTQTSGSTKAQGQASQTYGKRTEKNKEQSISKQTGR